MDSPWFEFIMIGFTFWFILPSFLVFCILLYCASEDNAWAAVVATFFYVALIQICSNFSFINWVSLNTWDFIKFIILFIICGVIFACVKYWFKLIEDRRIFDMEFQRFLKDNKINEGQNATTAYTFKTLPEKYKAAAYERMRQFKPKTVYESTRNITFWMAYWPIVGLWTIINNPLKWLWEEIKYKLSQLFEDTHKKIVGDRLDVMDDWKGAKNRPKEDPRKNDTIKDSDWTDS